MKNLKNLSLVMISLIAIVTIQSCGKDDNFVEPDKVAEAGTAFDNIVDITGNGPKKDGNGTITLYYLEEGKIAKKENFKVAGSDLEFQKDIKKHEELWELVKKIIPLKYRKKLGQFAVYGKNVPVTGSVSPVDVDKLDFHVLGINIDVAYFGGVFNEDGAMTYTIIHELGHLVAENNEQLDPSVAQGSCKNYVSDGCSYDKSYINQLYTRFWSDIYKEFLNLEDTQDATLAFHTKYKDRFLTWYAASNISEDIAEVFAGFVTMAEIPKGNSIAEQKIKLVYEYPELVELRKYIRETLPSIPNQSDQYEED